VLDWRELHRHGADRGAEFYVSALTYGQHLWQRGLAARALLAVDRALLADVPASATAAWPLPYRALRWLMTHASPAALVGNPRVHFQHLAGRVSGPRASQQRARAWAAWHLACLARPDWPGDALHMVEDPTVGDIAAGLREHGLPGELATWLAAETENSL
jgi:hypothetical protein